MVFGHLVFFIPYNLEIVVISDDNKDEDRNEDEVTKDKYSLVEVY